MRPQFNRVLKVKIPPSLQSAVEIAAHRDHSTVSDFIRRMMIDRLRADGVPLHPLPKINDAAIAIDAEQAPPRRERSFTNRQ
jgi:hypothetical protein